MQSVRLRPTTEADLDFVLKTESDVHNRRYIGQWSRDQHAAALQASDKRHLIVERSADGKAVGYVILEDVNGRPEGVQFRRIALAERGRGYGKAAVQAVTAHVFDSLGAGRIWLDVMETNAIALAVYKQSGFREVRRVTGLDGHDPGATFIIMALDNVSGDDAQP